jgi:putative zinc finger protein
MNHLTSEALNLYLDGALDPRERAAANAHLARCETCQAELSALRQLFATIELLPLDPLPVDLTPRVLKQIALSPEPRVQSDQLSVTQRVPGRQLSVVEATDYGLRATDYGLNPQPVLVVAALIIQGALATALGIWLAPQLVGVASTGLGALALSAPFGLTVRLTELNGWLAAGHLALSKLARAGDTLSWNPFGALTTAEWIMLLIGIGVVWFFGNRFLLAGSLERRGNHQEAA